MTTNAERDYRIAQIAATLIEEHDTGTILTTPQEAAKRYVQNVLDNGYMPDVEPLRDRERDVWEMVRLLGFDPERSDPFVIMERVSTVIDECDLFND